jgi:hypothetical protein
VQAVALESLRRLFRGARAREREHGAVLQPEIVGTLGETLLGEIDGGQELASPLCVLDRLEPVDGPPAHATAAWATGRARGGYSLSIGGVYASPARTRRAAAQPNW